jgi:hypothetical protein
MQKRAFDPADLPNIYRQDGFSNWRASVFEVLASLPKTDAKLSQWVTAANLVAHSSPALCGIELTIKGNSRKCRYGDLSFESVFGRIESRRPDPECYLGTVHSVKGKSLPAVMLVLKRRAGRSANYVNLLGTDITTNEELRILYVALSRASQLLVVAVPHQDVATWRKHFQLDSTATSA